MHQSRPTLTRIKTVSVILGTTALLQACGMLSSGRTAPSAPSAPSVHSSPEVVRPGAPSVPGRTDHSQSTPAPQARPEPGRGQVSRIPDKAINLNGSCTQTEEDGYREQATLNVQDNQVLSMTWQLWVGKKGTCTFNMGDFRQTQARPSIEMVSRNGSACKLVIFQDPRRITLGFAECQNHCTGKIYDEAYPVMFDPRSGGCADLSR